MDVFSKSRFLVKLVVVLVVLNTISILMLWFHPLDRDSAPPHPRREHNVDELLNVLSTELGLSEKQKAELKNIREAFFSHEKPLSQLIRSQRDSMNILLFNSKTDTITVSQIAKRVGDNEYKMELYRIRQARQLQSLCTDNQLKRLDKLVIEIRDYFRPKKNEP